MNKKPLNEEESHGWAADLVGLPVAEAEARVQTAGMATQCILTSPPWAGEGTGVARVVRVRKSGPGVLELTVAWEGYTSAPRKRPASAGGPE